VNPTCPKKKEKESVMSQPGGAMLQCDPKKRTKGAPGGGGARTGRNEQSKERKEKKVFLVAAKELLMAVVMHDGNGKERGSIGLGTKKKRRLWKTRADVLQKK